MGRPQGLPGCMDKEPLHYYPYPKCSICDFYDPDSEGGKEPCPYWEDSCERALVAPVESCNTEEEWLSKVAESLRREGYSLSERTLKRLWVRANTAVTSMGDIFWDADKYEQCMYCHLFDEGCPNSQRGNPADAGKCPKLWYGSAPGRRMLTRAAVPVFEALIAAAVGPRRLEYVKVVSREDNQEAAWAVLLDNRVIALDSVNGSDFDSMTCEDIARNLVGALRTQLNTVTLYCSDGDEYDVLDSYVSGRARDGQGG